MHAVFHPINALLTAAIIQTPLILLGVSPEAVLLSTMLIDLQSLVSHFNADVRTGWLNYIFIGTETHRYHHSADPKEAGNFGNTLAIWDLVFATFCYRPGNAPEFLGVENPGAYPPSELIFDIIALPFRAAGDRRDWGSPDANKAFAPSHEDRPADIRSKVSALFERRTTDWEIHFCDLDVHVYHRPNRTG
jgi:hypothetical protein